MQGSNLSFVGSSTTINYVHKQEKLSKDVHGCPLDVRLMVMQDLMAIKGDISLIKVPFAMKG